MSLHQVKKGRCQPVRAGHRGGKQGLGEFDEWEQDAEKVPDVETNLGIRVGAPGTPGGLWGSLGCGGEDSGPKLSYREGGS